MKRQETRKVSLRKEPFQTKAFSQILSPFVGAYVRLEAQALNIYCLGQFAGRKQQRKGRKLSFGKFQKGKTKIS